MKVIPLVRAEFARIVSTRLGIISLIALLLVPIIYGGLYLWGNKDPYGNLDKVPAALVVADKGATVNGKSVNYGRDAAANLLKGKAFGWKEVTESEAKAGVTRGTYDFAVTFPAAFSANLASAADSMPVQASIDLRTDDTNSYLSTTIAKQATEAVRTAVSEKVGKAASRQLLDAVATIRTGLVKAQSGASSLAAGATSAASGAASLSSGLAAIDAKTSALPSSSAQLKSGSAQVASGASKLASGIKRLAAGAKSVAGGASQVSSGVRSAHTGSAKIATGLAQLDSGMSTYRTSLVAAVESNPLLTAAQKAQLLAGYDQLHAGASQASAGSSSLTSGLSTLSTGASKTAAGAAQTSSGAVNAATGAASVSSGAAQVASGNAQLAASAPELAGGIHKAATGAASLGSGVTKLDSGASKLSTSLKSGADKVPASTVSQRAAQAAQIATPAAVKQHAVTTAQNYGAGLAPFFISLASWIGLYALFLLVRPLSRRALTAVRRPIRTTLAGWITPAVLGAVQTLGLFLVVTLLLGLRVANPVGLLGFMFLTAITFAAMVLALNVLFGSAGQFLALILMIVQLVTAGGTFPWQTLPGPLAFIHQALPMAHAVDGVRTLMYGGSASTLLGPITFLLYWLLGSLLVAAFGAARQGRSRTLVQMRPGAIGG